MRQFDEFLLTLSPEELRRRFDPGQMAALEIYAKKSAPAGAQAVEEIEHLLEMFDELPRVRQGNGGHRARGDIRT